MNKVFIMGRLTKDPEMRYSSGDNSTAIAHYSVAVNRKFKKDGQPDADFFNCVAFGKTAEFIEKYLKQGSKVIVEGNLQNNNYTNKNGEKVYAIQINTESIEFAESKKTAESNSASASNNVAPPPTNDVADDFLDDVEVDEELPF